MKKVLLFSLVLFVGFFLGVNVSAQTTNWSDPNTWGGSLPVSGQNLMIPMGQTVVLDVSPPPLGEVMIMGTLRFEDKDLAFTAESIMIDGGTMEIGTEDDLFESKAIITLTGAVGNEFDANGRFIMPMQGGTIEFHGISATYLDWSQITKTVAPGETSIDLKDVPTGWKPGDQIVLAASSFDPNEAEQLTITQIDGNTVRFSPALKYAHYGEVQEYGGMILDERAEVGLLTRNILIKGGDDSAETRTGGHIMILSDCDARLEGVELYHMGQTGREARYPLHWHFTGDKPDNYARHNSIHHSFHRGIVVHQTHNMLVERNVAYDIMSHTYVPAEDGVETGNKFYYNLGILTRRLDREDFAFPREDNNRSTQSEHRPGTFWYKNPLNELIGNHAAGADGMGFFLDRRHTSHEIGKILNAIEDPMIFRDNVAHSNFGPTGGNDVYGPLTRGYGIFSDFRTEGERIFQDFTTYKNSLSGTWIEGPNIIIRNSISADNNTGHMLMQSTLENSVIVGQSANMLGGEAPTQGVYRVSGAIQLIGHGGPKQPQINNIQIIDQRDGAIVGADKNTMANSFIRNLSQVNVDQPFWYRYEYVGGAFEDRDGSLAGYGPSIIVSLESDLKTMDCIHKPDWRAYVCPYDTYNIIYFAKFDRNEPEFPNLALTSPRGNVDLVGGRAGFGSQGGNRFNYIFKNTKFETFNDLAWPSEFEVGMELKPGTWDIVTLDAIGTDVVVRYGEYDMENKTALPEQASLTALEGAQVTSYFYDKSAKKLHLKYVYEASEIYQAVNVQHSGGVAPTDGVAIIPIGIYPNPVIEGTIRFTIAAPITDKMVWALFDASGSLVKNGSLAEDQSELNLGNNATGFYVLQFLDTAGVVAQSKLLIE